VWVQLAVAAAFVAVYVGMGLGRWPGLAIDRTGVALVGAVFVFAIGGTDGPAMLRAVDFSTLAILFALMVVSAQVEASGFFSWCGRRIARADLSPSLLLGAVVAVTGGLAALLTNDVVVWALVPVVTRGVAARGLDARPFVIGMAAAANAGSAATVIGNPQNLLIGQVGHLPFWRFAWACGVPAVLSLGVVFLVIAGLWRNRFAAAVRFDPGEEGRLDRRAGIKALAAAAALVAAFSLPVPHAPLALAVAALLLLNRHLGTRRMLGMVDWHLLLLFTCLFIVTGALVDGGLLARTVPAVAAGLHDPFVAMGLSLLGSNTIGNVPLVTAALSLAPGLDAAALYRLAAFSTLSGNFLIVGSMANIIAVERARDVGVSVGFGDYARIGVPVTAIGLLIAYLWLDWAL
jgi:Na+/H+ antiporter NhaD/arsenite permease-like protein